MILGVILPALAMLATRRGSLLPQGCTPALDRNHGSGDVSVAIAWVLVSGIGRVARITTEPLHSVALLGVEAHGICCHSRSDYVGIGPLHNPLNSSRFRGGGMNSVQRC